jgi:hypothetical protein
MEGGRRVKDASDERRKTVLGEEHPSTLLNMKNFVVTLEGKSRDADAMRLMEECFQLQKHVLGPQHSDTTSLLHPPKEWRLENAEIGV